MSGTTHDARPAADDGPPTSGDQRPGDANSTTVRVVDRRADPPDATHRAVSVRTETGQEQRPVVELDPWPLVSIGMLLGAIILVLLLHLLGVV